MHTTVSVLSPKQFVLRSRVQVIKLDFNRKIPRKSCERTIGGEHLSAAACDASQRYAKHAQSTDKQPTVTDIATALRWPIDDRVAPLNSNRSNTLDRNRISGSYTA